MREFIGLRVLYIRIHYYAFYIKPDWAECLLPNSIEHGALKSICSLKICSLQKCLYEDTFWVIYKHFAI